MSPASSARYGRIVVVGSRGPVQIDARDIMTRELTVTGIMLFVATPEELAWRVGELFDAIRAGALKITVGGRYPLAAAAAAHAALESRATGGKLTLIP